MLTRAENLTLPVRSAAERPLAIKSANRGKVPTRGGLFSITETALISLNPLIKVAGTISLIIAPIVLLKIRR
jgi:hypothetical protein